MVEPSEDPIPEHRPLPSVDLPLLREERRANRMRHLVIGSLFVLLVGASALGLFFWHDGSPNEGSPSNASETADIPVEMTTNDESTDETETVQSDETDNTATQEVSSENADDDETGTSTGSEDGEATNRSRRTSRRFGQAPGFRNALVMTGCSGSEADALIAAMDDVMDFRRCRPDDRLVIERAEDGTLARFEYRASVTRVFEATRDDEGTLIGRQMEIPVEQIRIARGGTIRSSLGSALEQAGLGRSLVGVIVEVFEGRIDFNTNTRAGDTFRVIVDEERIGGRLLRYGTLHAVEFNGQRTGEHRAYHYAPREDLAGYYDATGRAVHGGWLRTPLRYDHISSPFDPRRMHPILRRIVPHNGVDYAAGPGTPVWATANGTIHFIGPRGANGNLVVIRHERGYESFYAHLLRFARGLERGDRVQQRQVIGYVGSTGRSTGPHLHFGLKRNGRFVDPQAELNGPGRMLPAGLVGRFRRLARRLDRELNAIPSTRNASNPRDSTPQPAGRPAPSSPMD